MTNQRSPLGGNKRFLLLAAMSMSLWSLLPISSHAEIFWDDEMESGNTGYEFPAKPCNDMLAFTFDATQKVSGGGSVRLDYAGDPHVCGGFCDRYFTHTDDLWGRFYIRLSPDFVVNSTVTKVMRNDTNSHLDHWWVMMWGSNVLLVGLQNYPTKGSTKNLYANVGDGTIPLGEWTCIETHIKHNTVGKADGLVEAYKNGVRFLHYPDLEMRKVSEGTQDAHFESNRMYRQGGKGSIWYDRLAFGNERIGVLEPAKASPTHASADKNAKKAEKAAVPAPPIPELPAIDAEPHRQAILAVLKEDKSAGAVVTLSIMGKDEEVLLEKFDLNSVHVSFSGNSLPLPWDKLSADDLARIALACGPNDGALLFHAGALAFSAKNLSLTQRITDQLWGVDAVKAKELGELTHRQ
jgi:hypothetical protein